MANEWYEVWPVEQYINETEALLQDMGGKLRGCVSVRGGYEGTGARPVKQYGQATYRAYDYAADRKSDTPDLSTPTDARWIIPDPIEWGELVSDFDRDNLDASPLPEVMQYGAMTIARGEDDRLLKSFFADAQTGTRGGTTTNFDQNNTVDTDVGGVGTGINHDKIRRGMRLLMGNEADVYSSDGIYMAITEIEWEALFGENVTISGDYVGTRPIETARLPQLYGVTMVPFSDARLSANIPPNLNVQDLPMWQKSGMHMGIWRNTEVKVLRRDDKRGDPHPYIRQTMGATRLQEDKVIKIQVTRS